MTKQLDPTAKPQEQTEQKSKAWRRFKTFAKWSGIAAVAGTLGLCGLYKYQVGPHTPKHQTVAAMVEDKPLVAKMIEQSNARPQTSATKPQRKVVNVADLKQNIVRELRAGFEEKGLEHLKSVLKEDMGIYKLQIALSDHDFFYYFRGLFEDEGKQLAKAFFDGTKPESPLLDILADRDMRGTLTTMMKTGEGQAFMNDLASTTYGDHLVGMLLNGKGGAQLVLDLLSNHDGLVTVDAIIEGMTRAAPIRAPPDLPPFTPTPEGQEFKTKLTTPEGVTKLATELGTPQGRQANADLFKTNEPESRSTLRDVMSTESGRSAMATIMQTPGGQAFMQKLGEYGLGQKIGGDDLWLSPDGRALVAELLKTEDGKAAILKLVTGFGAFSEALASVAGSMPKYEGAPPAATADPSAVPTSQGTGGSQ
jgi:hypothetical protein